MTGPTKGQIFLPPWMMWVLPFIGGHVYALAFPSYLKVPLFPLLFVALFLFFWRTGELTIKRVVLRWLIFSVSYIFAGYSWLPYLFQEFGHLNPPFNYLLWPLASVAMIPQFLFFLLALKYLSPWVSKLTPSVQAPTWALIMTTLELLVPQQFPTHASHPWLIFAPYLFLAPICGQWVYSYVTYWMLFEGMKTKSLKTVPRVCWGFSALFIGAHILLPLNPPSKVMPLNQDQTRIPGSLNIRLVQGNIGNFLKIDSETGNPISSAKVKKIYKDLTLAMPNTYLDLVVWPETALPEVLNSGLMKRNPGTIPVVARDVTQALGLDFVTGGYDMDPKSAQPLSYQESEFNTVYHFGPKGTFQNAYHKRVLIPFGETLPFGSLNSFLIKYTPGAVLFSAGQEFTTFTLTQGQRFITPVCYEMLLSSFIRDYLNSTSESADFILNLTNDSWYGKSAEPFQHQFLAHWRALEFQIPIVRSTNTGLTSVLMPDGSESERLPWYQEKVLDFRLELGKRVKTPYEKWGYGVFLLLSLITIGMCFLEDRFKKIK